MAGRPRLPRDEEGNIVREPGEDAPVLDVSSPELQDVIKAAVEAKLKEMLLSAKPTADAAPVSADVRQLFDQMALAISEIADQGTNRKKIAPEILAARAAAHKEYTALIEAMQKRVKDAREAGDSRREEAATPHYRVRAKVYFNERMIEAFRVGADRRPVPVEIYWTGRVNDGLVPLNEAAKEIFSVYRRSVGLPEVADSSEQGPVWVTQAGLVVKGEAPAQRRQVMADPVFADDLKVTGEFNPNAPLVRVLGTVAEPARQSVSGG